MITWNEEKINTVLLQLLTQKPIPEKINVGFFEMGF
jgi:hypothetical protein